MTPAGSLPGLSVLARCLPHTAARRLGAAVGRLGGGVPQEVLTTLRAAFPELGKARVAALARDARARRTAAAFDGVSACRFDSRALCRRLRLSGWSHLQAAESRGKGLLVLGAGFGSWQLAALAVALYRGAIETLGPWRSDPVFGPLAASFERPTGRRLFGELAGGEQLEWTLLASGRVGFLADQAAGHGPTTAVPFLGRTVQAKTLVARASIDTGAPVVPVFGRPRRAGGWNVEAHEPIDPSDADAEALTARYLAATEGEIRRRPAIWWGW